MSNLQDALDFFDLIAATSGANDKKAMLKKADALQKDILKYALDPYRMYGVKKFQDTAPFETCQEDPNELFRTLNALQIRKVTGGTAVKECEFVCGRYGVPPELLRRILNKDLRMGVGPDSVNKVFPRLIPEFKVALAQDYEEDDGGIKLGSIKYDGLRCLGIVDDNGAVLKTRNGLPITSAPGIQEELDDLWINTCGISYVFDGEIIKRDAHFQDTSGAARKKKIKQLDEFDYFIFDVLPLDQFLKKESLSTQRERLRTLCDMMIAHPSPHLHYVQHEELKNNAEIQAMYQQVRAIKHEGLILKDPEARYSFTRNSSWTKLKDVKTADCEVVGLEPGKGKYEGMIGAIVVNFNGKPNRVGSGMSDAQRGLWKNNPNLILHHMVEIAYHEETKDGNMRHSRLVRLRPDKE